MKNRRQQVVRTTLRFISVSACWAPPGRKRHAARSDRPGSLVHETKRSPIVFVHGLLEVGDAFAAQSMRFCANGYSVDSLYVFDWNSFGNIIKEERRFAAFVDRVLETTDSGQVGVIGHSVGCILCLLYLKNRSHADKVSHYIHIAGGALPHIPWEGNTLTLSSPDDPIVGTGHIPGAENITLPGHDHLRIATSPESFFHMFRFLNRGQEPATVDLEPQDDILLSGRLLTFAQNQPAEGRTLNVYPVDPQTGARLRGDPAAVFRSDREGRWGPFRAVPGRHYEYEIPGGPFMKPLHYYREPMARSCPLVYFRVFPPVSSPLGSLFFLITRVQRKAMYLATLNINQAVIHGRDKLRVNGLDVSTDRFAEAAKNTLAIFYTHLPFLSEGKGLVSNRLFPFIQVFGLQVDTREAAPVKIEYNGRIIAVPRRPVDTGGVTIVVLE